MSNDTSIASLKEKIDDLNQQAWEVRVNDSTKAYQLSEESVKLARSINYTKGLAEGLRSLGFGYIRLFKNEEAAPLLRESLSLFESLNDLKGQAVVYEYLGIIERNWGNLGASLELLLKGYALIQQVGSLEIEVTNCYQIGVTYKHLGNHESALDYLYKALSIAKKTGFILMEAYAMNIIGSIYFDNGDYNQALDCYQQGLIIRQQSHDKWGEAGSLDNIGFTHLKLNDLEKAIDYCNQSLAISQSTGDKKGEANALLHLAEIYQQAGDVKQASKFSNESLEIRKARGDRRGETEVLLFLADLHKNSGDIEDHRIFEWLSGALKTAEEIKAQDLLSKAYYDLHEYHTQKGNFKESLTQLEAHLQIEKELHKNTINQKVANLEISHKAEAISERNKELTELNEKIEKANEELKVEASLERVRAVTMSMNKPDDVLNICKVMFKELLTLEFKDLRNALINFWDDDNSLLLDYDYSDFSGENFAKLSYSSHPVFEAFQKKVRKATDAFAELVVSEHELETWKQRRRDNDEYEDPRLNNISVLYYYFYSTGVGALGISTFSPIPKNKLDVLKRFRNVFDLTYRRYLDIVKAETQAREAQIEAALERVRSRSLAMHQSSELEEVIMVVSEQLQQLQFRFHNVSFVRYNDKKGLNFWLASPGRQQPFLIEVPYLDNPVFNRPLEAFKNGVDFIADLLTPEENHDWLKHLIEHSVLKNFSDEDKKNLLNTKSYARSLVLMRHIILVIGNFAAVPYTEEQNFILKRFANVFDQAYTRFLDLQKAEAQAREAQIQLALERVRARTMAMQKSDELQETNTIMFQQIESLGIPLIGVGIHVCHVDEPFSDAWMSDPLKGHMPKIRYDHTQDRVSQKMYNGWKEGESFLEMKVQGEELKEHFEYVLPLIQNRNDYKEIVSDHTVFHFAYYSYGLLVFVTREQCLQDHSIFKRFAIVFEQTYTRFLDLQKAEAQAREAQIEAGLERVRSRSLAMHYTSELQEVIHTVHKELLNLNIAIHGGSFIAINSDIETELRCWGSGGTADTSEEVHLPLYKKPFCTNLINGIKNGPGFFTEEYTQQEKKEFFTFLFKHEPWSKLDAERKKETLLSPGGYTRSCCVSQHTSIFIINHFGEMFSALENDILKRFGKVFEQSYTRFLDLQKAEAQGREAQIEAALERVRSRSIGMQKSEELKEVIRVVYEQFVHLNILVEHAGFIMDYKERDDMHIWLADQHEVPFQVTIPYFDCAHWNSFNEAKEKGTDFFANNLGFEEKNRFYHDLFNLFPVPKQTKDYYFNCPGLAISTVLLENVGLYIENFSGTPYTDEENAILMRFGKVFQQTYTRFLDLQKAEAQAREAKIETALERTRTQSMIMQHSNELDDTLQVFHEQVLLLGINSAFSFLWLPDEEKDRHIFWAAWGEDKNGSMVFKSKAINYPLDRNEPATAQCLVDWKSDQPVHSYHIPPEGVENYFAVWKELIDGVEKLKPEYFRGGLYYVEAFMKYGCFGVMVESGLPEDEKKILLRFSIEFERTYTRFLDLQKAEAQTREALIEGALERVRARALAMQQPEELKDVAQVLRNEMGALGVEELETCSIYIHSDSSEKVECWYALQDPKQTEKKMVSDHFVLNLDDTWVGREMKRFYGSVEKQTSIVMQGMNRKEWIKYCYEHSPVFSGFYGETIPDRTYHLYKFSHGYIGAAAPGDISGESWKLLGRAASVFSLAYSRFKDLTQARNDLFKLKEEKKRAEDALTELQATQKQLVQSEKMASLGELTAGIAHEIQNPLNFVNNFSDVSNELLDEMKQELSTGNTQQAIDIVNDVKDNLEKILHHGKRADAIVKSMLQHSRSSTGKKEPTDINALTEEYFRLAFHGLRAKDKSFNARFETDLDNSIDKINIVPQEMGRVILNLINNAFYAVNEKKNKMPPSPKGEYGQASLYEPTVTVTTKRHRAPLGDGGKIEIRVADNGDGIPQKVLDKIFQPFFTTKPTGQGTGLGLSLSYDIITKGHGGELKVETKEGVGSEFIISLPMN